MTTQAHVHIGSKSCVNSFTQIGFLFPGTVPDVNIVPVNISYEKVGRHKSTCVTPYLLPACSNVTVLSVSFQVVDSGYTRELLVRFCINYTSNSSH